MNKRQRKVFTYLKTKTKALGFNRKELEGIASNIDGNLQLEEDASDEDVDAAIEKAVEAALPFLQVSQSAAQRSTQQSIQRFRDKYGINDDDDDDDDDDDLEEPQGRNKRGNQRQRVNRTKNNHSDDDNESELMKLIKAQNEQLKTLANTVSSLQGDRVTSTRRTKLEKLVKDTGSFGKHILKQFDHMSFDDDDQFSDYLDEVEKDLDEMNQERANAGLDKLGTIPTGTKKPTGKEDNTEVMTDDEIIALAGGTSETK